MDGTEPEARLVVCDAGPLIHLDQIGCSDLLAGFSEVLIPDAVWVEVERHQPSALVYPGINRTRLVPCGGAPSGLEALARGLTLHAGELEALRIAWEYRPVLLLTDDTAARLAADRMGIEVRGTIGMLVRSIRKQQRSKGEILTVLQALPRLSTLHLKRSLLATVISEVEKLVE
jgi:predicted nucleic acid-binding protein